MIEGVDLAGIEVPVAGARAAEGDTVAGAGDGVMVDDVETQAAVAGDAGDWDRPCVAAAGGCSDGSTCHVAACRGGDEFSGDHARDRGIEGDGEVDARGVRRILRSCADDRDDHRHGLVDRVSLAGKVAVRGTRAADRIAGRVGDGVVVGEVEPERSVAGAGGRGDAVRCAAACEAGDARAGETALTDAEVALSDIQNRLGEGDVEDDAGGRCRRCALAVDRQHGRRCLVDRVALVAVARGGKRVARRVGDAGGGGEIQTQRSVAPRAYRHRPDDVVG